jgi:hypothetical protein
MSAKPSGNPTRSKLYQRMVLKLSSKFGTSAAVMSVIKSALDRNLEGKAPIEPSVFDSIEEDIASSLNKGESGLITQQSPKRYASIVRGVKSPPVAECVNET